MEPVFGWAIFSGAGFWKLWRFAVNIISKGLLLGDHPELPGQSLLLAVALFRVPNI